MNKVGICLSRYRTLSVIDQLAKSHDEELQTWKVTKETTTDPGSLLTGDLLWGVIHDHLPLTGTQLLP